MRKQIECFILASPEKSAKEIKWELFDVMGEQVNEDEIKAVREESVPYKDPDAKYQSYVDGQNDS